MAEWIGLIAAVCTTSAFVPQVMQVVRTKATRDISLGMYSFFCAGVLLWVVYGLQHWLMPVIISNLVTLVLAGIVLVMKLKEKKIEKS